MSTLASTTGIDEDSNVEKPEVNLDVAEAIVTPEITGAVNLNLSFALLTFSNLPSNTHNNTTKAKPAKMYKYCVVRKLENACNALVIAGRLSDPS